LLSARPRGRDSCCSSEFPTASVVWARDFGRHKSRNCFILGRIGSAGIETSKPLKH
jgi:hypothetical protein